MQFIPNSVLKESMLKEIGYESIEELFADIPEKVRIKKLNLPDGLSEYEVKTKLHKILSKNTPITEMTSMLGGGVAPHYIPSVVKAIVGRSEFYTSYTPYQPEVAQGMLQAIFEYQSMIAELTGMDVANDSMYDGASALSEAVTMCARITDGKEFIIPKALYWEKKSVLKNYTIATNLKLKEIPYLAESGKLDLDSLKKEVTSNTAGVYIENPNFFGVFEDQVDEIKEIVEVAKKPRFVVGVDLFSLGIVRPPGDYGADIVVADGLGFGNPLNFGGPSLGVFACKREHVRKMPGRLIGMTIDSTGRRAFCMTLQVREQHIRREKATSNICTNEALCALATAVYLTLLGKNGIERIGKLIISKAKKLATEISKVKGFNSPVFKTPHFSEFVIKSQYDLNLIRAQLLKKYIHSGLPIKQWFPELGNAMLCAATEMTTNEDIVKIVEALKEFSEVAN